MTTQTKLLKALRDNNRILNDISLQYHLGGVQPGESKSTHITEAHDVWRALPDIQHLDQEQFRVLLLTTKNRLLDIHTVYQGTVNEIRVRPAEALRPALLANAPNFIVAHNHPSGDANPSVEDLITTGNLFQAGQLFDIQLLDHIIIAGPNYYSVKSNHPEYFTKETNLR